MGERVLILGDDFGIFLAVVRSLGRRGIEVHVAPADPEAPGLRSRYVAAGQVLPPHDDDPAEWAEALSRLIAHHDYRLVIPCSDSCLRLLDHHGDELGRDRLALPNPEALAAFVDKGRTRALAAELGVPIAQGMAVQAGADALALRLGLPLVLKPSASYALGDACTKTPARIVRDRGALDAALAEGLQGWIAEAFFEGDGVGVSIVAKEGRILLAWQHRRRRTVSETGGSSMRRGEPPDAELLRYVHALAQATGLTGVAMFEFRHDRRSGAHVLLEVNPRFWGSLPLALAAGADFPALLWDVLTGAEAEAPEPARPAIERRSMTGEYVRLADAIELAPGISGRLRAGAALLPFWPGTLLRSRFDSWAADDPAPYREERRQLRRRFARALARRIGLGG